MNEQGRLREKIYSLWSEYIDETMERDAFHAGLIQSGREWLAAIRKNPKELAAWKCEADILAKNFQEGAPEEEILVNIYRVFVGKGSNMLGEEGKTPV